jgi:hypothetical protein
VDRIGERRAVVRGNEECVCVIVQMVRDRACFSRDDRKSARPGFEEHGREAVQWARGHYDGVARSQKCLFSFASDPAVEGRVDLKELRERLELSALGAVSRDTDADRLRQGRDGVQKLVEAFDRHEAPQAEDREAVDAEPAT